MSVAPQLEQHSTPSADTLAARAESVLQRTILAGDLAPDTKLVIHDLVDRFGIGVTPLREGLSRLVAKGLVIAIGQRGFRVARVSHDDLEDIIRIRSVIELEALRLAIRNGGDEWEANIVAGLHRMQRYLDRKKTKLREGDEEFDAIHKSFHTALIAACGSPRMLEAHSSLYDQTYRYRRLMLRRVPSPADFMAEHRALADLIIARDFERAAERLRRHLRLTLAGIEAAQAAGRRSKSPKQ